MASRFSLRTRSSGVLLHPTSLPGPHGIGDLGDGALRFAELLASLGQSWWQMLPVGPTGWGNSPYSARSSFSGNALLVSLHRLVDEGLLEPRDVVPDESLAPGRVNYEAVTRYKEARLRRAFEEFERRGVPSEFEAFRAGTPWLADDALYSALARVRGGAWWDWELGVRLRDPAALERARKDLAREVQFHEFVQFVFDRQWRRFRDHCAALGIGLVGDVPFFAAPDSADVWAHQDLFDLDGEGRARTVAGAPPDPFAWEGQRWGHPQYRWDVHRARGWAWWIDRLRVTFERFDAVRIDHFIGFHRSWAIPASAPTAKEGTYNPGPGAEFFERLFAMLGPLELIAEDLGTVPPEVYALLGRFDLPGIRVIQFGLLGDEGASIYLPHKYPRRCVAYPGTHDNDTNAGWYAAVHDAGERDRVRRYLSADDRDVPWAMVRAVMASPADVVIVPVQDVLGLGTETRMNLPGVALGNWEWRIPEGALTPALAARFRALTRESGRLVANQPV
jgi:4-alpha-glucanotransferase